MEANNQITDGEQKTFKILTITYDRNCTECVPMGAKPTGTIPLWLKGSLIRNGPGMYKIGSCEYNHAFDCPALLRKYSIKDGKVFYENKFLKSSTYKKNQEKQRIVVTAFGTRRFPDPCDSLLQRFMSYFTFENVFTDNSLVAFMNVNDEIYATSDSPYLVKVDPSNLDTLKTIDIRKFVAVNYLTAHSHTDDDGNVFNMGNSVKNYNIVKIPQNNGLQLQQASIVAKIPIKRIFNPSYYHSFSMTENYFVFIEQPLIYSVKKFVTQNILKRPNLDALKWKPEFKTKFYLISRKSGKIVKQKYISEPFVFFHTINAYEDQNHVIIDICCYENGNLLNVLYLKTIRECKVDEKVASMCHDFITSQTRRFVLPVLQQNDKIEKTIGKNLNSLTNWTAAAIVMRNNKIKCISEELTDKSLGSVELPTINYSRCNGKKYRYFYSVCFNSNRQLQLLKYDTKARTGKIWQENDCCPSEPIFVPRPDSREEDDGVILSSIVSETKVNKGFLLILDAKTFEEIGRASIETTSELPGDFHGCFLPQ